MTLLSSFIKQISTQNKNSSKKKIVPCFVCICWEGKEKAPLRSNQCIEVQCMISGPKDINL